MSDLKRCDICGCVQTSWSVEMNYFEKDKSWSEHEVGGYTEDYCPECTMKVNEAIAKIKKELE